MPTRFSNRYGARPRGQCVTAGCARATSRINGLCDRCTNNLRRHGEAQQTLPDTYALDDAVRRMEEARGRLKLLDLKALEARWTSLVDVCRGASPERRSVEQGR
jgi:predicted amidophosphoribosyltransferase